MVKNVKQRRAVSLNLQLSNRRPFPKPVRNLQEYHMSLVAISSEYIELRLQSDAHPEAHDQKNNICKMLVPYYL